MDTESVAFKTWLSKEQLVSLADLNHWVGMRLGVDAQDYLSSKLTEVQTREPLLPALGGLPFALQQHVDWDLENFRKLGIKVEFVFHGLEIACRDHKSVLKESQKAVALLDEAWKVYDQGRGDEAVIAFGKACTYRTAHITRYLQSYLHSKGVATFVAPYNASAQLVLLYRQGFIDAIWGSASAFMFGAKKIVTNLDWSSKRATFAEKDHVLSKLMLSEPQFVDLCLLAGASILTPMPEIDKGDPTVPKISTARAVLARYNNDGNTACLQAKDDEYTTLFRKAKAAVRFMVVMWPDGEVKMLDFLHAPSDVHEFLSPQLPPELFAYLRFGFVGTRVLNWRTRREIFETAPLDGGNSPSYRALVQIGLRPQRARSLAILTQSLHRYYAKQDVELTCWFMDSDRRALGLPDMSYGTITKDAETWHVRDSLMSQSAEVKDIDLFQSPLQYAIALLSNDTLAKKTVTRKKDGEHSILVTRTELLANTLWRFLQDRGYINSDHTLSAWGKALKAAFERASTDGYLGKTNPVNEAEEVIFAAFELLRLDMLTTKNMFPSPPYLGAPQRGSDADKANVMLVSRIASLGTFQHEAIGYTGPLSRHLLAFQQIASAVRETLRDLAEMHGCNMMLSASAVRTRDNVDYADVGTKLPFGKEPDLGLALVVKSYLDELSQEPSRRADIRKWFNHAVDIEGDLRKAWKMWDAINAGVQAADSAIVNSETKNTFQNADEWLHQKRQAPIANPIANGTNGSA